MNVQQTITIYHLRVDGIANSSVLQIGTAGLIKPFSNLYNTGGFTGPAPKAGEPNIPIVPFPPPDLGQRSVLSEQPEA